LFFSRQSDVGLMAKALSAVTSILLLVAADQVAARMKRMGWLPMQNQPHAQVAASNAAPSASGASLPRPAADPAVRPN
jgi:hypothetical protein